MLATRSRIRISDHRLLSSRFVYLGFQRPPATLPVLLGEGLTHARWKASTQACAFFRPVTFLGAVRRL